MSKKRFSQLADQRVDLEQVQGDAAAGHFHKAIGWTRTTAGPVFTIWGRIIIPPILLTLITISPIHLEYGRDAHVPPF